MVGSRGDLSISNGLINSNQIKHNNMDIKEIQNLIKFVAKSGVNEVAIEQGEFKITIRAEQAGSGEQVFVQQAPVMAAPQQIAQSTSSSSSSC